MWLCGTPEPLPIPQQPRLARPFTQGEAGDHLEEKHMIGLMFFGAIALWALVALYQGGSLRVRKDANRNANTASSDKSHEVAAC